MESSPVLDICGLINEVRIEPINYYSLAYCINYSGLPSPLFFHNAHVKSVGLSLDLVSKNTQIYKLAYVTGLTGISSLKDANLINYADELHRFGISQTGDD